MINFPFGANGVGRKFVFKGERKFVTMSDIDDDLYTELQDERETPEKSCRTRLKFNNERDLRREESFLSDEQGITSPSIVDNFMDEQELNMNQSNSKTAKRKVQVKSRVPAESDGEAETDTYDSEGVITFNKKGGLAKGKRKSSEPGNQETKAKIAKGKCNKVKESNVGPRDEDEN